MFVRSLYSGCLFNNCIYLTQNIVRVFNCLLPSLKRYVVVLNVACRNLYVVILHVVSLLCWFLVFSHCYIIVVGEV